MGMAGEAPIASMTTAGENGLPLTSAMRIPGASPARKAGPFQTTERMVPFDRTCAPSEVSRLVTPWSAASWSSVWLGVESTGGGGAGTKFGGGLFFQLAEAFAGGFEALGEGLRAVLGSGKGQDGAPVEADAEG